MWREQDKEAVEKQEEVYRRVYETVGEARIRPCPGQDARAEPTVLRPRRRQPLPPCVATVRLAELA